MSTLQSLDLKQRSATNAPPPGVRTEAPEVSKLIDISKCIGCKACQVACGEWNDIRDKVGINSIQDMTNFTPGLQYSTSTDRISLRGVGRLTNVLSADASVANYADGVYETFAVRAGASTLFTDRVEVLRGPQGTLYGRNSIAGALNIISRRPTDDPYAEVRIGLRRQLFLIAQYGVDFCHVRVGLRFGLSRTTGNDDAGAWARSTGPADRLARLAYGLGS